MNWAKIILYVVLAIYSFVLIYKLYLWFFYSPQKLQDDEYTQGMGIALALNVILGTLIYFA